MKNKAISIDILLFIFSPLLSIPLIIKGIYLQKKISIILFCMMIGIISLGYIPVQSNDKAYYLGLFNLYQDMPPTDFFEYFLSQKTDIIFYTILYLTSWFGLPFEYFSFLITFITLYLIFSVLLEQSIINEPSKKQAFLFFIITLLALSLPDLISGMRNYLAIALAFYGFNLFVNKNKLIYGCIFIFLSVLTHFSSFLYIPILLIYYIFNRKVIKYLFVISIGFIFLPKQYLLESLSVFQISDIYSTKANAYLTEDSFLENSINVGNFNNLLRIYFTNLWFYIALTFSILNLSKINNRFIFFLCLMTIFNIISPAVDLLIRYGYLGNLIFLFIIFFEKDLKYRNFFLNIVFFVNMLSFLFNFMAIREPLILSLSQIEYLTLPTTFLIDATTQAGIR